MNCLDCQQILHDRLDGAPIADSPELKAHLADCPECRRRHHAALLLLERLPVCAPALPPVDLRSRIVTAVLAERTFRIRRRRFLVAFALAASILLAIVASLNWLPVNRPSDGPAPKTPDLLANHASPPLEKSVEEARQAVASLTGKGKEHVRMLFAVANPIENPGLPMPDLADMGPPLEPAAQSLRQAGEGVSQGLQTVTQSAQRAVAYFFRELSTGTRDARIN
jgi:hypothetical protein